jgi:hypothetical protein
MTTQPIAGRQPAAVPRHARIDVIGGALIVLLAGLIGFGAIQLNTGSLASIGPGALPNALAVVLLAAGVLILFQGLTQSDDKAERFFVAVRPTMIVVAAISIFGLFIRGGDFDLVTTPQLGLMIVGPLTVFIAGCATPDLHVKSLLVLAIGLTAAMLVVFVDLLGVTVPVIPKIIQDPLTISFGIDIVVRAAYAAYGVLAAALYAVFFTFTGKSRV